MGGRISVVLIVLMLSVGPASLLDGTDESGDDRGPAPLAESSVWTDSFDDLSHVHVPAGGLVGVEVTGGQVQLETAAEDGWIASTVISAMPGMRYDYIFVEAVTPGNSYINITVENASAESLEVGFANGTIDGFKLREGPYLSLTDLDDQVYPDIRIQVNLVADGADRPYLLSWSLYFVDDEAWRDDFIWPGRMADHRGLNFTDGHLEVNLTTMGGSGGGDYDPYPPIVGSGEYGGPDVYYVNTAGDGYDDRVSVGMGGWASGLALDDLNNDGYYDLLFQMWVGRLEILWGDSSGTWSPSRTTRLDAPYGPEETATGDFDGDGWFDFVIAQSSSTIIYLNDGDGNFADPPEATISMSGTRVSTGDLDKDGYDDILLSDADVAKVYMGGDSGPSTTAAITFSTANCGDTLVQDLDGDGHLDVLLGERNNGKANIYLGARDGPDTTADYSLTIPDDVGSCEAGDVNGDGYTDVLLYSGSGSSYHLYIFEGNAQGWSDSRRHDEITHNDNGDTLFTADLDKDGYEDILQIQSIGGSDYRLKVWYGDTTWPSTPDIVKESGYDNSVVVAMPKEGGGTRAYRGTFLTEPISIASYDDRKWDMLDITGSMPQNTSLSLTVVEAATGDTIRGYEDLTDWNVDLSGIDPDLYRTIQVEVTIESEFNTTTPVLDRILVKWMDRRVWRDEFYGAGKVDRSLRTGVSGGALGITALGGTGPQLLFTSVSGDEGSMPPPRAFLDAGGFDYTSWSPMEFIARGTSSADVADVNGDGYLDVAFSVYMTGPAAYGGKSPLFLGSPLGPREQPAHEFNTVGATAVLLRDLNDDGHVDVVFAQEQNAGDYAINSTLYWGSADGWSDAPDVEFGTRGASDVDAVDVDGDGLMDLVFACYRDASPSTYSMLFVQNDEGFNGSSPTNRLATHGARAVASGDLDDDDNVDLVFANSFRSGFTETDSFVYWGTGGGAFSSTPTGLPTMGATDVEVADLDRDGDLDLVFANGMDNALDPEVDSAVYMNDGSGGFASSPDNLLATSGASGVVVADLDGSGWKDLVFSCSGNSTTRQVPSVVYLGGASGWGGTPNILMPTEGASDVMVADILEYGNGGYLSVPIALDDPPRDTGTVHTLRYNASVGTSVTGKLRLVDTDTWEVLGETSLRSGANEWDVRDLFSVRLHPVVRVMVVLDGLGSMGTVAIDDVWFNWTQRAREPPRVSDLGVSRSSLLRLASAELWVNVTDDYDLRGELVMEVQHRVNGTEEWSTYLLGRLAYDNATGSWKASVKTQGTTPLGVYDFRATAMDLDGLSSVWLEFPRMLEVLNNLPTAPKVIIMPATAVTTSALNVEIVEGARDVDGEGLTYLYRWYRDGVLYHNATSDSLAASHTSKGENWSVEVVAFDGDDEGPPGTAWVGIANAPPFAKTDLPDPDFPEDTIDSDWLDLSGAFEDPDGDPITWSLASEPEHIMVSIDPETGRVTLEPDPDWFGYVNLTFVATDGEGSASQTVEVHVTSVNDAPRVVTVDGEPLYTDPMVYTVDLGKVLTITFAVADVEGDEVLVSVNTTAVVLDEEAHTLTFDPGTEAVGTFSFALRVWDVVTPSQRSVLNFTIKVVNPNDPMEEPVITQPVTGATFKVNQSISLVGECVDPDVPFGQELEFIWSSDLEGELGRGASIVVNFTVVGDHTITLTVKDPDYERSTTILLVLEAEEDVTPPPPPDGNGVEAGTNWTLVAMMVIVLVVVGVAAFLVVGKRSTESYEARMDAEEEEEEKREALERTAQAIKDVADRWETESEAAKETAAVEATRAAAEAEGWELEGFEAEPATQETDLGAGVAQAARSSWVGVEGPQKEVPEEDPEARRVEDLKRTYQNAIGRLPFGVPSRELASWDWVDLTNALVTGEKRTLEGGVQVTAIDGRWYYSDPEDTDTFLKEHGTGADKGSTDGAGPVDKADLLARLEERFIRGEISEETYLELLRKYRD